MNDAAIRGRKGRLVEAHGEWKTLTAWARDPRCVVTLNTLRTRRAAGWKLEDALSTPGWQRRRPGGLTAAEIAALKDAAELVRNLPRPHRNTPADAPGRAAVDVRNRLIREAAAHATVAEVARAVELSHETVRGHVRGAG
jgi:hypothetical protein